RGPRPGGARRCRDDAEDERGDEAKTTHAASLPHPGREPTRAPAPRRADTRAETRACAGQRPATILAISSPASVGLLPTCTPASRSASILAWAVPLPPETMAPAWPIFFPGGAVTPAM